MHLPARERAFWFYLIHFHHDEAESLLPSLDVPDELLLTLCRGFFLQYKSSHFDSTATELAARLIQRWRPEWYEQHKAQYRQDCMTMTWNGRRPTAVTDQHEHDAKEDNTTNPYLGSLDH